MFLEINPLQLFACVIITSTAHVSLVFPSRYRITIFNQSAGIFSLAYFLKVIKAVIVRKVIIVTIL